MQIQFLPISLGCWYDDDSHFGLCFVAGMYAVVVVQANYRE